MKHIEIINNDNKTIVDDSYVNLGVVRHFTLQQYITNGKATIVGNYVLKDNSLSNSLIQYSELGDRKRFAVNRWLYYNITKLSSEKIVAVYYDGVMPTEFSLNVGIRGQGKIFVEILGNVSTSGDRNPLKYMDMSKIHIYTFGDASCKESNSGLEIYNASGNKIFDSDIYYAKILGVFTKKVEFAKQISLIDCDIKELSIDIANWAQKPVACIPCTYYSPFLVKPSVNCGMYALNWESKFQPKLNANASTLLACWGGGNISYDPRFQNRGLGFSCQILFIDVANIPLV